MGRIKYLILIVCVLISACGDIRIEKLEKENKELKEEIEVNSRELNNYRREENIRYERERHATIASVCMYFFDICPENMSKQGKLYLAQGVKPNPESVIWWRIIFLKVITYLALLYFVAATLFLAFYHILRKFYSRASDLHKIKLEFQTIENEHKIKLEKIYNEHQQKIEAINKSIEINKNKIKSQLDAISSFHERIDELEGEESELTELIENLKNRAQEKQEAAKLIGSFKV